MIRRIVKWYKDKKYWNQYVDTILFVKHEIEADDKVSLLSAACDIEELEEAIATIKMVKWYEANKHLFNEDTAEDKPMLESSI